MLGFKRKTKSQKIKEKARKNLHKDIKKTKKKYAVDTSVVINRFLPQLIRQGLKGEIIVPNAVIAELEHLANKGKEEGFIGLDEVASLHNFNNIKITFKGPRPSDKQIKYAKSGGIDALIRKIASENKAILITADLVQAKSAQAYGIEIIFLRPKIQKKKFLFWRLSH